MSEDPGDAVSRRDFGRLLGAAALSGMLPNAVTGTSSASGESSPASSSRSIDAPDELCDLTAFEQATGHGKKRPTL